MRFSIRHDDERSDLMLPDERPRGPTEQVRVVASAERGLVVERHDPLSSEERAAVHDILHRYRDAFAVLAKS